MPQNTDTTGNLAAKQLRMKITTGDNVTLAGMVADLDAALLHERRATVDPERLAMAIRLSFGQWRDITPPGADMKMAQTARDEYVRLTSLDATASEEEARHG